MHVTSKVKEYVTSKIIESKLTKLSNIVMPTFVVVKLYPISLRQ